MGAKASSYTTHPGIIAAEACAFLCHVIIRAFEAPRGMEAKPFLESVCTEYLEILAPRQPGWGVDQIRELVSSKPGSEKEACWNWKSPPPLPIQASLTARGRQYNGYPVSAGYFGSYSLDGLAMPCTRSITLRRFRMRSPTRSTSAATPIPQGQLRARSPERCTGIRAFPSRGSTSCGSGTTTGSLCEGRYLSILPHRHSLLRSTTPRDRMRRWHCRLVRQFGQRTAPLMAPGLPNLRRR